MHKESIIFLMLQFLNVGQFNESQNLAMNPLRIPTSALADPGGAASTRPSKGPDSFVLTYKFYEMQPHWELATPLWEILDPALLYISTKHDGNS